MLQARGSEDRDGRSRRASSNSLVARLQSAVGERRLSELREREERSHDDVFVDVDEHKEE